MTSKIDPIARYVEQTAYSDPRPYAASLDAIPTDLAGLSSVSRNVIVHYRAHASSVDPSTRDDIHLRWLAAILQADATRHPDKPLFAPRPLRDRVQGCCRDHALFCVGALRRRGIPARSRVGFARYLTPGFNHDHVVVEMHNGDRWVRFDPEIVEGRPAIPNPLDMAKGPDAPFATAAEVWRAYRNGEIDPDKYGVAPGVDVKGPWMIQSYVLMELAHLEGDELLLWDAWGSMSSPEGVGEEQARLADEVAALLLRADGGDYAAQEQLDRRYAENESLRSGETVLRISPYGDATVEQRVGKWPGLPQTVEK